MEISQKIGAVLTLITNKLTGINYALIGSANLYMQGLDVKPRDIDLLTTPEDIWKIDKILVDYRIKEIYFDENEGRNSLRGIYCIDNIEIEVLGNVNNAYRNKESLDHKINVEFKDSKIACIPLIDEYNTYRQMGRSEKAEMVHKFLQRQK